MSIDAASPTNHDESCGDCQAKVCPRNVRNVLRGDDNGRADEKPPRITQGTIFGECAQSEHVSVRCAIALSQKQNFTASANCKESLDSTLMLNEKYKSSECASSTPYQDSHSKLSHQDMLCIQLRANLDRARNLAP